MIIKLSAIFELLRNYDSYGFDLLYENYFRIMYGVAFSISKDDEISKDAIQNTMIKLYKLEGDKYPNNNELTWLYKVVKNETLQLLRKEKTKISIDDIEELPSLNNDINNLVDMESYEKLVEKLPEKQRKIVTLKIVSGLTHKEIANVLDMPIGTVLWSYNTGIKKLKIALSTISSVFIISLSSLLYNILNVTEKSQPLYANNSFEMDSKSLKVIEQIDKFDINIIFISVIIISLTSVLLLYIKSDKIPNRVIFNKK